MAEQQFWQIVDAVKIEAGNKLESRPKLLERKLSKLEPAAIQSFQHRYEILLLEANRWSLWGAAYLMNGGCSDDGFKYFRDWLISEGKTSFKAALANPDSLASFEKRDYFDLESYGYAALHAHAKKGAGEIDRGFEVELAAPEGTEWEESDLPRLFPRLAAKYLGK
jgi:hypothetical protein